MKGKHIAILMVLLIVADQLLKIWIKTNMSIGEAIIVFPDWFQLRFIENNGAAFGMQLSRGAAIDWGKMLLSAMRVVLIGAGFYYLFKHLIRKESDQWVIVSVVMILAGAIGNMIDCALYGMIFSESTVNSVAHFGGSYSGFMMGKVVDMFYFPLFQWNGVPKFLSFLVDGNNYFFGAIFNLADSYISVGVVLYLILEMRKEAKLKNENRG